MPTKTKMLDYGNFVYSPQSPMNEQFREYLGNVDRLFGELRKAEADRELSPFSPKLKQCKRALADYISPFKDAFTVKSVERIPAFLHISQFFAEYHPVQKPFSILHCSLDMPLHTVLQFPTHDELSAVNAALDERTPLRWWQDGPMDRPCYLFGQCVWELKPSEVAASEEGCALLFIEALEKDRHKVNRLKTSFSKGSNVPAEEEEYVSKEVRTAVWHRDRGKCAVCGSREQLDFQHIIPLSEGGSNTAENVRLLCERCRSKAL